MYILLCPFVAGYLGTHLAKAVHLAAYRLRESQRDDDNVWQSTAKAVCYWLLRGGGIALLVAGICATAAGAVAALVVIPLLVVGVSAEVVLFASMFAILLHSEMISAKSMEIFRWGCVYDGVELF